MKEEQKNPKKPSTPEEEIKLSSAGWKQFFKKKWFFPALYLALAALILALITWYQNPNNFDMTNEGLEIGSVTQENAQQDGWDVLSSEGSRDDNAIPVTAGSEKMMWPVAQDEEVQVVLGFFDDNATEDEQAAAMVEYDRTYYPSEGIALSHPDGKAFDVLAALSGTVVQADKDPLVGNFVEIEHENGLVTVYQSLENLEVQAGDKVNQGDLLGKAGRNLYEKELGVHVHFQVRENGVAVNPDQFIAKTDEEQQ